MDNHKIEITTQTMHQDIAEMLESYFSRHENEQKSGFLLITYDENDEEPIYYSFKGNMRFLKKATWKVTNILSRILEQRLGPDQI